MKVIAVGTLKGGAGKTTMLFNIAGVLAEKKKVLLIDLDPQCNLSGACGVKQKTKLSLRSKPKSYPSSRDIFRDDVESCEPEDLLRKAPIDGLPLLDIIPSHILMTAVELFMVNKSAREWVLDNYIKDHKDFFEQYDYVLLDTNPSMGVVNQNAFTAADSIILTTDISEDAIEGVEAFCYLWDGVRKALRKPDNIKALVINNADRRLSLTSELQEYCEDDEDLRDLLIQHPIYSKAIYKDARLARTPVNKLKKGKNATADIKAVVNELFERGVF